MQITNEHGVISILGMRGSGKTYKSVLLVDELKEKVDKIYLIDVVSVYSDYLDSLNHEFVTIEIDKLVSENDFTKLFKKVEALSTKIVVYDISYLTRKEMTAFMDIFSRYLLRLKKKEQKVALICDEVGEYAEQERGYYSQMFETLVRIGRNKNVLFVVLITQRAQKVNKHLLALSDYYLIFRLMHNLDLEAVKNVLGYNKVEWEQVERWIRTLQTGEHLLYDGKGISFINADGDITSIKQTIETTFIAKRKLHTQAVIDEAIRLYNEGYTAKQISEKLGVSYDTVRYWIKKSRKEGSA